MATNIFGRAFTTREKALVAVLVVIILASAYYFGVHQNIANAKAQNEATLIELEDEILVQSTQSTLLLRMQSELDQLGSLDNLPVVAVYDNVGNEPQELNAVLASTSSYKVTLSTPVKQGSTIRRAVDVSFSTANYESALSILEQLQNGSYYCQISDADLTAKVLANGSIESVNATLKVTFFETATGATNLNGVEEAASESNTSSTSATAAAS
ncbi:MAG: hypothetical protein ACOYD7_06850 [Raoultibacter sp.]|jgi:type II secretory pathway component PulM